MHYPDPIPQTIDSKNAFPISIVVRFREANQTGVHPERTLPAGYWRRHFSCTVPGWHEWFATVLGKLQGGTTRPSDLI
ncbi:hypothetical protein QFZ54_003853 [Sphingomonas faeni]|nr:hypothetical protein [Sphingomonas faeni]